MSLLKTLDDPKTKEIAREVFERQFRQDPRLEEEYDDRRKSLMYEDIIYNLSFLDTAVRFDDPDIFRDYSVWIFHLLRNLMKDLHPDRVKDHMLDHYRILGEVLSEKKPEIEQAGVAQCLEAGIAVIREIDVPYPLSHRFQEEPYAREKQRYLDLILRSDTRGAIQYSQGLVEAGMPLEDLYVNLIQEAMYEIGELWHQSEITVDKEHYATSVSQMVLSRYYEEIFGRPRIGKTVVSCCVGSELHEMGARMVSDLFEYHGWDSVYLGAAVPIPALLHAVEEHHPDLLALSVTMTPHLVHCADMVDAVRARFPDRWIAVGGRAFTAGPNLWKKMKADTYEATAVELIRWANENIAGEEG